MQIFTFGLGVKTVINKKGREEGSDVHVCSRCVEIVEKITRNLSGLPGLPIKFRPVAINSGLE